MADNSEACGSTRPRRSARTPAKAAARQPGKRKARTSAKSPAEELEHLLTHAKSHLTKIDISNVLNYNYFLELSQESQLRLCSMLPPTAFLTYRPSVCSSHPDFPSQQQSVDGMDVDQTPATLDPMVFTSPFFLSAAHTWQDHLFSSWLGQKASDDLEAFKQGAKDGTLHAPWKDEAWDRDHQPIHSPKKKQSPTLDLTALAKQGLIQEGDVIVYKRIFTAQNLTVEKDLLVDAINPGSHTITFLLSPGTKASLHPSLLVSGSHDVDGATLSMDDIADPVALERGVLDVDGRVSNSRKYEQDVAACPHALTPQGAPSDELKNSIAVRAWKAFTLWRWREEMRDQLDAQLLQERGARERVATLFYLRGCASGT
ncbi:hypothetical protein L226DRAFT_553923 [Lentinus tigrinus ALCF2SS1-7]|uniref:uncharacterized protein n=1 Tax=Lentinus tigrinus ALCF2SS1-7 TaxID=1328758 RepID=UPI001165D512|nr:hypothetical protein L226DRAFT_553923 [Lentinus tigrinus ALCF2SS1-7]